MIIYKVFASIYAIHCYPCYYSIMSNDNVNDKLDDTVNQMLDAALTGNNYKVDSILNDTINSLTDDANHDTNYLHRDYTLPDFLRDYTSSANNASNTASTNSNSSTQVSDDTYIQVSVVDDTNNADDSNTEIIDAEIVDD